MNEVLALYNAQPDKLAKRLNEAQVTHGFEGIVTIHSGTIEPQVALQEAIQGVGVGQVVYPFRFCFITGVTVDKVINEGDGKPISEDNEAIIQGLKADNAGRNVTLKKFHLSVNGAMVMKPVEESELVYE